ncbi:MAG TPA: hypothetical protein VFW23_17925 [Tepidisphaeraceae bacterium]|nr:hypothetical protein [Tepidisphaeraceae bacterium]
MRRPARTRRLSIAAITSCTFFVMVAAVVVRSFWTADLLILRPGTTVVIDNSVVLFAHAPPDLIAGASHQSWPTRPYALNWSILKFSHTRHIIHTEGTGAGAISVYGIPLGPLLLLLLIAPVRWLIARPANVAAFPVVTEQL